jgi:hypothetical protein
MIMSTRIAIPNPRKAEAAARDWNEKHKIGCKVDVTLDDRSIKETKTSSEAWVIGGGIAVIKLEGISGGYSLSRVHPVIDDSVPYQPANV